MNNIAPVACHDIAPLCWVEAHPGTAGWAQALGTVLALVVAIFVARMPIREQRRRDRDAQGRLLVQVMGRAEEVLGYMGPIQQIIEAPGGDVTMMLETYLGPMQEANRALSDLASGIVDGKASGLALEVVFCGNLLADRAREAQRVRFMEASRSASAIEEMGRLALEARRAIGALQAASGRESPATQMRRWMTARAHPTSGKAAGAK